MPDPPGRKPPFLPLAAPVGREPTLTNFPGPVAPGTKHPLPPPRQKQPSLRELDQVTAIRRPTQADLEQTAESPPPPRQDARSEATDTPIGPQGPRRERLPQGRPTRSVSPAPWDPRASSPELRRETERMGDRLVHAPESAAGSPPSDPPGPVSLSERGVRVSWQTIRRVLPYLLLGTGGIGGSVLWEKIRTGLDLATASSVAREQEARKDLEGKVAKDAEALARESARVDALACRLRRQCAALERLGYRTGPDCQGVEFLSVRLEGDTVRGGPLWRAEGDCPTLPPPK